MIDRGSTGSTALVTQPDDEAAIGRCLGLVAGTEPRRDVLIVTFGPPAETILDAWRTYVAGRPANVGIVAVGNAMRSTAEPGGADESLSRNVVRGVSDPADHEGTKETIVAFLEEWNGTGNDAVVYVESVATLVRAVGSEAAAAFVENVTELLEAYDCPAYFRADASGTDDTATRLASEFDRVRPVRGRQNDDDVVLSMDDVFGLLSAQRRRLVLHLLGREETPISVESLARRITRLETGGADNDSVRRTYVSLRHVHLPKLEEHGVVSVDSDRNAVEPMPGGFTRIDPALSLAAGEDIDGSGS